MQARKTWVLYWATIVMVFAFSMPAQAVPGDMDQDGDMDWADYALLRDCFLGPQIPVLQPGCQYARFDVDSDVDLGDIAGFLAAFTGSCPPSRPNDSCRCPIAVGDGTRSYSNVSATTDGPDEPAMCNFFGYTHVEADIWYCYTASCTGTALVSLCGSSYDTKLAVYAGCGCPTTAPLACSDDDCGTGVENVQSRVEISVTQGQQYMVRVGGYLISGVCTLGFCTAGNVGAPCTANAQCNLAAQGDGRLTIGCNVGDACVNGSGDCFVPSPSGAPGCGDAACCAATCNLDQFCCDVNWDASCAGEAQGVCTGSFPACAPGSGSCGVPDATPGCGVDCCNRVCMDDPFCCLTAWDEICVDEAESMCFLACTLSAGSCSATHPTPGCNLKPCCQAVCSDDSFCCDTEWDEFCVEAAVTLCP